MLSETAVEAFINQKPWHESYLLDPSFPFRLWDTVWDFSLHWHDFLEIVYVIEGNVSVFVNGTVYDGHQGDILIINSRMAHGFCSSEPGNRRTIFQFGLELLDRYPDDHQYRDFQKLVFDRKIFISREADHDLHQKLEQLLLSIRHEYYQKEDGFHLAIKSNLYKLALIYLRDLPAQTPIKKELEKHNYNDQILDRVLAFIHSNLGNPEINLEHVACTAALSKFYFTRFFKAKTGQTFHTYLSQIRINRAKEYLTDSDLPITEISYLCGFSSIKTFNRIFKTIAGIAPSAYRSNNKDSAHLPVKHDYS